MRTRRTLVALKIRSSRGGRQLAALALILGGFTLLLGAIGGAQAFLCRREHPGRPIVACLRGLAKVLAVALLASCSTPGPEILYENCSDQLKTAELRWARELKKCRDAKDVCAMLLDEDCADKD